MRIPQPIIMATRNPGKLREIVEVLAPLGLQVVGLDDYRELPEPPETGGTFAENACLKAAYYARKTGRWCLADDSGLEVDALEGRPGVQSARYAADQCPPGAGRQGVDAANNARLLRELADVPAERRTARFVCHLVLAGPGGVLAGPGQVLAEAFDTVEGSIGYQPRGANGFGYDPLFCLPQMGCTSAELSVQQKNRISHRGKALAHLAGLLAGLVRRGA